jgi:hypothetical protein
MPVSKHMSRNCVDRIAIKASRFYNTVFGIKRVDLSHTFLSVHPLLSDETAMCCSHSTNLCNLFIPFILIPQCQLVPADTIYVPHCETR